MSATLESLVTGVQVGTVLPLLTAVVQRPAWSTRWKKVVAVVVAVVAGVGTVAVHGGLAQLQHGHLTVATLLGVLAASQTTYDLVWKPSQVAPMIEALTTPKAPQQAG
ncbi:hypothetical protein ABZ468_07845 [Streptomyces sp. NPDC005708]|uniref:hypothetical protein n=1 Tax=Streptomyces sp. NPDC005708 TaxID=3154564 RepID=UPI0034083166